MPDTFTKEQRSRYMARVKNKNTAPEIKVRQTLHRLGYRFRLHRRDLPGSPDIVLPRHNKVIFVHGCFWHGHNCPRGKRPSSNTEFWNEKLDRNLQRDQAAQEAISELGWHFLVVWQCQTKDNQDLERRLLEFMHEPIREYGAN